MYKWQTDLVEKLKGKAPGEMTIMMSGRRVGKSIMSEQLATYQQKVIEQAAARLAEDIDFDVLAGALGYQHEIDFNKLGGFVMNIQPSIMDSWCGSNCKGHYIHLRGLRWLFELEQDLNWFKLRWL